jgi:hypothetical protein
MEGEKKSKYRGNCGQIVDELAAKNESFGNNKSSLK